jgi:hypothetical protein
MKLRASFLALAGLALLAAPAAHAQARKAEKKEAAPRKAAAARTMPTSWYALRITRGDTGLIVTNLWSAGRNLRAEAVLSGVPIQQLVSGEWYYVIDAVQQQGIAVRRSAAALRKDLEAPTARPFGNEAADLRARGAEPVRDEEVAGRKATVYRLTDSMGRHEVWLAEGESALPIRIDSTDRESGVHVVTDYVDWISSIALSPAFFEPDPRIQLERLEYDDYVQRAQQGPVGPAPVLFGDLLHGAR